MGKTFTQMIQGYFRKSKPVPEDDPVDEAGSILDQIAIEQQPIRIPIIVSSEYFTVSGTTMKIDHSDMITQDPGYDADIAVKNEQTQNVAFFTHQRNICLEDEIIYIYRLSNKQVDVFPQLRGWELQVTRKL